MAQLILCSRQNSTVFFLTARCILWAFWFLSCAIYSAGSVVVSSQWLDHCPQQPVGILVHCCLLLLNALSWNLRHVNMGSGLGGCVNVPGTCVLRMMLHYHTLSWNLHHVTMWSGVDGYVNVPGTCVLKMMLRYSTLYFELASCHHGVRGVRVVL